MDKPQMIEELISVLGSVRCKITDESDVVWTKYDSPAELRAVIDDHIERLRIGDMGCIGQLTFMFAPTGSFQEHSISNGWGKDFIQIANRFDEICGL